MIRILAVGKLRSEWARAGCEDYRRRIARFARLEVHQVADSDPQAEGKELLSRSRGTPLVVCDRRGEPWSSQELAQLLGRHGSPNFFLGGPEGISEELRQQADHLFAMGAITLPHELARVVLLEQIYRGLSILRGHPYHR